MRPRVLVGQVAGAVGTNATLGDRGLDVRRETMAELGLGEAPITWHVSRDCWTEVTMLLGLVGATMAKFGLEIALLMRTEVGEVGEPFEAGRGASSTLPQKRNPIICQPLVATGRMLREKTALALDAMVQDHERGIGAMHLEWSILPEAFVLTGGAVENAISILDGLVVDEARMRANLDMLNGLIMSEAVMMGLAPHIGRNQAHDVVYEACAECADGSTTLREVLIADARISDHLSEADIDGMLDPANYLGTAREMVDRVLATIDA
jgi:3-carboxy-cis,cis-muconate cycloisomerase